MNIKELKEMINLMNENNLSEIEIEKNGLKVKLKRQPNIQELTSQEPSKIIIEKENVSAQKTKTTKESISQKLIEIKAPMVGTFYRAPSPESPAFVEEGDELEVGQIICIIEAMKLMNEIKSEVKGRVKEILIENGQPVEFGQTLFLLEPL